MKARSARKVKKKANWPLRILVIAGVAFLFVQIWRSQDQLKSAEEMDLKYQEDIQKQAIEIENLTDTINGGDVNSILESEANELGYYKNGQQIYRESAG